MTNLVYVDCGHERDARASYADKTITNNTKACGIFNLVNNELSRQKVLQP